MKILYHHRTYAHDGMYVHIEELTSALREQGHEIIVVGPPRRKGKEGSPDSDLVTLLRKYFPRIVYELLELAYNVLDYARLVKATKRNQPDCLYERYNLYLLSGVWLRRRYKLPMLLEVNSPLYAERKKYGGIAADFLARWAERMVWHGADYVLPVTHVLADLVKQTGIGEEKILVISNAVNPRRFNHVRNTEHAKAWLGLQNEIVLGFVGFMREWHGLERVIDLLAESEDKNRHLLLVGDGPARQGLEELAQRRGISEKVTITGVIGRDNVASYIAAFDIALQPNVVEYASPLKLFEYMALGRAIVAPSTSNIKEVLDHGENAILFNPDDYEDFANAIETVCRDRMLRDKISRAARKTICDRGLTWANNAKKVVDLFSCLVAKRAV